MAAPLPPAVLVPIRPCSLLGRGSVWGLGLVLLAAALLVGPSPAQAQSRRDAPRIGLLIERIALALGGAEGGSRVLDAAEGVDFIYRRTVLDIKSGREMIADHRYLAFRTQGMHRLDIRMVKGTGKDSAAVLTQDAGWLVVDRELHPVEPGAIQARLGEFSPDRVFAVPLALAADGRQILGDASLSVAGRVGDGGQGRFILVGTGPDGQETARLEIDARSYRPVEVAFQSPGGHIVYRYGDYREVGPGLVIPFEREFLRNGVRLSRTEVRRLRLGVSANRKLFDPEDKNLGPLPSGSSTR